MDLSGFNIDWNKVEEVNFEPVPAGTYAAKIIGSKIGLTKKKDGTKLDLTIELLGQFKGRKVFDNMMLKHPNPKAVQIGLGKMKSIAKALDLDLDSLGDTSEFHGKPIGVKLKIEVSDQYGDKNRVTSFLEYSEDFLSTEESTDIVEVEETVEDVIEDTKENTTSPLEIRAFKKNDFLAFVKTLPKLQVDLKGMKLPDAKEAVIAELFGSEIVDEEDIIIED